MLQFVDPNWTSVVIFWGAFYRHFLLVLWQYCVLLIDHAIFHGLPQRSHNLGISWDPKFYSKSLEISIRWCGTNESTNLFHGWYQWISIADIPITNHQKNAGWIRFFFCKFPKLKGGIPKSWTSWTTSREVLDRFGSPTAAPAPTKALVLGIWQQHLQMAPRGAQWRPSVFCLSFILSKECQVVKLKSTLKSWNRIQA